MIVSIDPCHNPLRGYVQCTGCGTPLVHMQDSWHELLAMEAARANGEEYSREKCWNTPSNWYPYMMDKAARMLCDRVAHHLFCPYCGKPLTQPFISDLTGQPALPEVYGNNFKVVRSWAERSGLQDLPVDDYHKWDGMARGQRQQGKPKTIRR